MMDVNALLGLMSFLYIYNMELNDKILQFMFELSVSSTKKYWDTWPIDKSLEPFFCFFVPDANLS